MGKIEVDKIKGSHYILDFFGCNPEQLDSMNFWREELPASAKAAGMEILHDNFHQFNPHGITGFLLLSTSHISFHTWPEYGYVACDVFSCSSDDFTRKAVDHLKSKISHKKCTLKKVERGYVIGQD
jgi:S-adenosylmethionine decarboxylase proenzyme